MVCCLLWCLFKYVSLDNLPLFLRAHVAIKEQVRAVIIDTCELYWNSGLVQREKCAIHMLHPLLEQATDDEASVCLFVLVYHGSSFVLQNHLIKRIYQLFRNDILSLVNFNTTNPIHDCVTHILSSQQFYNNDYVCFFSLLYLFIYLFVILQGRRAIVYIFNYENIDDAFAHVSTYIAQHGSK
jgi:hypothetical protein